MELTTGSLARGVGVNYKGDSMPQYRTTFERARYQFGRTDTVPAQVYSAFSNSKVLNSRQSIDSRHFAFFNVKEVGSISSSCFGTGRERRGSESAARAACFWASVGLLPKPGAALGRRSSSGRPSAYLHRSDLRKKIEI